MMGRTVNAVRKGEFSSIKPKLMRQTCTMKSENPPRKFFMRGSINSNLVLCNLSTLPVPVSVCKDFSKAT